MKRSSKERGARAGVLVSADYFGTLLALRRERFRPSCSSGAEPNAGRRRQVSLQPAEGDAIR